MNFKPKSSSQKFKSLPELMATTTRIEPPPSDGSPQIEPSPEKAGTSSSWVPPTDTKSGSTSSSSQHRVPSPLNPGDNLPSDSKSFSSDSTTEEYQPNWKEQSTTSGSYPSASDQSSDRSHPPTPDNYPPPPANPGPSTGRNPPSRAKRPRPEESEVDSLLSKIPKGKFKRRISSSGALNAA